MITSLKDVESFLNQGLDFAKDLQLLRKKENYTLDKVSKFLAILGHPEKRMITFHVAGSKGKGTTSYILANLLALKYRRCGLFLSPFVYDFRERFCTSDGFFPDASYIKSAIIFEDYSKKFPLEFKNLSIFEKYLVYSVILFDKEKLDCAVFEVGLGGRYDATNALDTKYKVFTTIEKEHTDILGKTCKKIAIEKSKIIKPATICFALNNTKAVDEVFLNEAQNCNSKIYFLNQLADKITSKRCKNYTSVKITTTVKNEFSYNIKLFGRYFVKDSALAILALDKLGLLVQGFENKILSLKIPGRFEIEKIDNKIFVLDGAHTQKSIAEALRSFRSFSKNKRKILIFGCAIDKPSTLFAEILTPYFDEIIVTPPGDYKQSDISEIYENFSKSKTKTSSKASIFKIDNSEKLREKINQFDDNSFVLVTGSFYLVQVVRNLIMSN